jgi:signal transduction histidine kinase
MISVLYVDDELALLDILKIYLEQIGKFQVDTALSARIALEKLRNSRYDVVVADYQMPEMDGIAFLVELRKMYPVLPFIIFTGKGREEVVIEAFEKGADFYLQKGGAPKPQFAELARKIEMAVERRRAESALREREERFRSLFDHLIEGNALHEIICNDRGEPFDYRILEVNAAYETLLGIPRDAVVGKCSREVYRTDEPPYLEIYARVERTGHAEAFETYYAPMRKHFIISVYSPKKGQFATVFEDITRRKQTEDALRQANKKLNLMSSITRHDILNQLLVLRGFLELSRDYVRDPENMITCIEKEEQAARQIQHQITFTRDYQDMSVQAPVWQPVREIIAKAVQELPMGSVQVEVTCSDLELFADRLLEKVFYNLIENALRHGGMKMTTIRISSQASDKGMTLVVDDDGIGISREDKNHLFERGYGKHSGFGLFLSREILSITGIAITETGTPGTGARFEITVPHDGYRLTGSKS